MFTEIMNVLSLGNKIDGVIDHITGNRLDNVGDDRDMAFKR